MSVIIFCKGLKTMYFNNIEILLNERKPESEKEFI